MSQRGQVRATGFSFLFHALTNFFFVVIYAHGSKLSLSRVWLDISAAKQRLQRLRDADRDKTRYPATLEKELEQFFEGVCFVCYASR